MSETVLASLVLKLDTLRRTGIHEYVNKARHLVEILRGSLRMAEADGMYDLEVEVWASRVRFASYALEDVTDEIIKFHLLSRRNYVSNALARFRIKAALERFKIHVETIDELCPVPAYSDSVHRRPSEQNYYVPNFVTKGPSPSPSHWMKDELVGLEEHKNILIKQLMLEESSLIVVSVLGMGGLGKTTLAKEVYHDAKVRKHFETCIWVNVPREFKEKEIMNILLQQLNGQQWPHHDQEIMKLKEKVHSQLATTRYVIVLDGVWTVSAWHSIKHAFPDTNLGSRVIITTRSTDVAYNTCKSPEHMYLLPLLPEVHSRTLFYRKIFVDGSCPSSLMEASESILKKCSGIPIAILAMGGMLRSKTNPQEWDAVRESLGPDKEEHNDDIRSKSAYRVLLLSYNDLPFHLKACYLYLSMFPEDHLIECARMIRLWIAEGLVEVMESIMPEDVADVYITELINRSLLQVADTTSDGRVKACRIPRLLRTIIIMKSRENNFIGIGEEHNESWSEEVRRLSIRHNLPCISKSQMQQIRSLVTFDVDESLTKLFKPALFYSNFKLLTVLDLKGARLAEFPATIVDLSNLKYLSLRETEVESIHNSIGMLQNLETLDLKHTRVKELPKGIVKLQRLRNLLLYSHKTEKYATFHKNEGFKGPKKLGKLQSLLKLCFIEVGADTFTSTTTPVSEIAKLRQLRRLGIVNLRRKQNDKLCSSIKNLVDLRSLSVTCSEYETMEFQRLNPSETLQRLYLTGKLESLPQWFSSLKNLVKIFLKGSRLCDNPLKMLQGLPNLIHIELLQAYEGKDIHFEKGTFSNLRILGLNKLQHLQQVTVAKTSMPNLEKLVLQDCLLLQTVPAGIEHLQCLKVFHLISMPRKLVDAVDPPPNEGSAYLKVQHIPEVTATSKYKNDIWRTKKLSKSLKEAKSLSGLYKHTTSASLKEISIVTEY